MAKQQFDLEHVAVGLDGLIQALEKELKPTSGLLDLQRLRSISVIDGVRLAKELVEQLMKENEARNG